MPSKHSSHSANTSNPRFNCPHALKTHFTQCQHLKPPFQLPPCPQNTFHPMPTPQTPVSTAPMPSKHISPSANTSNPLFNSPHALKTHFTHCQHLKPPFQLTPCPQNTFHPMPTPQTPFSTAPMPSKHISPSANTSDPLFNCPHALKTHFTQCQHLKPPFQLPPWPQNTCHPPVPTPQTPFSTHPMPSKHISHSANTLNPLFNSPHALKTHFTQCQHLTPPFQLPLCPQNIFHPVPTPPTPFSTAPMASKHISPCANTSNPLFNYHHAVKTYFTQCQQLTNPFQLPPCPENTFHTVPTPQTPFSTPHFTQCQHLTPPFQLTPCPQNIFHPVPTPQTPFSTAPMASKHISPSANTSNPLFNYPHALKTYFTQCQHLKPPFQLPPCPENIFHTVPTPQTPFSTAPMPSKRISHSANTSNPPFQLPPCRQNIFHPVPTPHTPFSTAPMPSKHISPNANTSQTLFNCPHALKTHFTQCQHLKPPFQLPPCPQNIVHTVPTPQTPVSTAPMPSKHISPNANTSNPLFNCPHALKTYFKRCQHLKPPFQLPPCRQNISHPVPTPQTPFSTPPMPSKHISHIANTSNPVFN